MRALRALPILFLAATTAHPRAQTPQPGKPTIGTVGVQDATVAGDLSITNGRAILVGSSSVTAMDHTAEVALDRGGVVRVCATSGLHLAQSQGVQLRPASSRPLMLALDRGAIEVQTAAIINDVVMTPDLRLAVQAAGPLDLRIRVTKNGDTCVENKGAASPTLGITDPFSGAVYQLRPGQHVLFEHGSLKEVVDNESSPCGCPPAPSPGMSVAEALLVPPGTTGTSTKEAAPGTEAAAQHPFPAAVSQGLAPTPPIPQAALGAPHAQVAATLGYNADGRGTIAGAPVAAPVQTPPPVAAPHPNGFGHRVGHFFKRLFGGH